MSYCNQCGTRLGGAEDARVLPTSSFNFMLAGVIGLPFIGLGMLIGVIAALKNGMGFRDDFIFAVTFLTFLLFAIAEIGCVIMLLTRTKGKKVRPNDRPVSERYRLDEEARRGLGSPIFEPAVPVGSVTDRTTRTLEHASLKDE
ncbi:MAG: hypothetical protein JO314_13865 [Acidobacteria bacterium]|nr:hypothetical protein [Acidobacteriota bacterium]